MTRLLLSLVLLSLAAHVGAQVYKTVGPDGKITYSDRLPTEVPAQGKVQVLRNNKVQPLRQDELPEHPSQARRAQPSRSPSPQKQQLEPQPAGDAFDQPGLFSKKERMGPGVAASVGNTVLMRESISQCISLQPASRRRYQGALDAWTARNRHVMERTDAVLGAHYPPGERGRMEAFALLQTRMMLQMGASGPLARRTESCDKISDGLLQGGGDLLESKAIARMMELSN
jgi:hypothetical protein